MTGDDVGDVRNVLICDLNGQRPGQVKSSELRVESYLSLTILTLNF